MTQMYLIVPWNKACGRQFEYRGAAIRWARLERKLAGGGEA